VLFGVSGSGGLTVPLRWRLTAENVDQAPHPIMSNLQVLAVNAVVGVRNLRSQATERRVQDLTWGKSRPEAPRLAPIVHWLTPVFDEDFAIHAYGVEDPAQRPIYDGLAAPSEDTAPMA
jgi:hypothetical protein